MIGFELHVIVPGALNQRTGGYVYDARMVEGLRRLGWQVVVPRARRDVPQGGRAGESQPQPDPR